MKKLFYALILFTAPLFGVDDLVKNVKHLNDKTFVDNIPQVSQKRNFCAPASASMILRYYDTKIPQNKLARLFDTSKKTGTSTLNIMEEFNRGAIEGFSIKLLYCITQQEFDSLIDAYGLAVSKNKLRKSVKLGAHALEGVDPKIAVPIFAKQRKNLSLMLPELLKKAVDQGIPLLWSVEMNLDPEDRIPGAHMRILVGYAVNKKGEFDRVLYRDSWGKRTDIKSMSLENAVAMTYQILVILPTQANQTK